MRHPICSSKQLIQLSRHRLTQTRSALIASAVRHRLHYGEHLANHSLSVAAATDGIVVADPLDFPKVNAHVERTRHVGAHVFRLQPQLEHELLTDHGEAIHAREPRTVFALELASNQFRERVHCGLVLGFVHGLGSP